MANVEKFKYWCNKILPLVYDDSLSYYEFLGKVYEKLNETIDAVNSNTEAVAEFDQRINDFIEAETLARTSWEDQQERDRQSWETTETANRAAWERQQTQKYQAFMDMFVDEYDQEETYTAGDVCSYEGKMYVANGATSGSFHPNKWNEIVLAEYLADYVQTAAANMQTQYDTFLDNYQRQFGVVQILGTSTTDVLSQNASRLQMQRAVKSSEVTVTSSNLASYNDCNTYPINEVIFVTSSIANQVAHCPEGNTNIITFGALSARTTAYGGMFQLSVPIAETSNIKYRVNTGSWQEWKNLLNAADLAFCLKSSNIYVSTANVNNYNDVNNYPYNSIVFVEKNASLQISNTAAKEFGTYITTGYKQTSTLPYGGEFQIFIPFTDPKSIMFRSNLGGTSLRWSNWMYVSDNVIIADPSNFIEKITNAARNDTILLMSGTYELFDSTHDEAYWKAARPVTRYCGLLLKNGITIRGLGNVIFNAKYTGTDDDIKENFSVFNVAGDYTLDNIHVEGENICYIIHDDSRLYTIADIKGTIKNCFFDHKGSDHTFEHGAPICIGAGTSTNGLREYINNIFKSVHAFDVVIHTNANCLGKFVMSGNWMQTHLRVYAFGSGGETDVYFTGNSTGSDNDIQANEQITYTAFLNEVR